MKNVAIAVCITFLTLVSMIAYNMFLNRYFVDIHTKCNSIINEIDLSRTSINEININNVAEKICQITDMWDKKKNMLYFVCNHQLIEEIDKTILSLKLNLNENNKQSIYDDMSFLAFYLNKFMENEKFSIKNVF